MSRQVGSRKRYSDETLQHAVDMVRSKSMSLRQAAMSFQIPKSSLSNKVNEKTPIGCRPGPSTVMSKDEEAYIAKWLCHMARIGFGRTRHELLDTVKEILDAEGRVTVFKDNRPGKDWYYAFLKRHPEISVRAPQQLAKERAIITPEKVEYWFKDFSSFMAEEVNDSSLWSDPSRWFNADESGFPLCPKSSKVLAPRGVPNVYNFTSSDKTQVTVLACMSANGYYPAPLIVYPGKRFAYNPLEGFTEAVLGRTDNGWMDAELFSTWLKDVFEPALTERSIKRPVVLFVDGHSTHSTFAACKFCRENNIVLYCLLEHASHLMQPCDLKLFSSLKGSWKAAVRKFQMDNIGEYVTKGKFSGVFKNAWETSTTVDIAVKGFRDSGLFPLDPRKILGTLKMEPSRIFRTVKSSDLNNNDVANSKAENADKTVANAEPCIQELADTNTDTESSLSNTVLAPTESETVPASSETPSSNSEPSPSISSSNIEPSPSISKTLSSNIEPTPSTSKSLGTAFTDILKIPVVQSKQKPIKAKRVALPKAISGNKFHEILLERKQIQEEQLKAKEQRKQEREARKLKKQEEEVQKQKLRQEKKEQREAKRQQKETEKQLKATRKVNKRKHTEDSDSDSSTEPMQFNDDELDDVDVDINQEQCYACEKRYDGNSSNWVTCHKCPRWLHRSCVSTIDLLSMTESEIADMQFECDYC